MCQTKPTSTSIKATRIPYLNIYSIERTRQPKHQVCHLNQKNTPTKTLSTPSQSKKYANQNTKYAISIKRVTNQNTKHAISIKRITNQNTKYAISIKRICQPKHQVRHLNNKKSLPTKTPSTPSQSKEYANQNTKYTISIKTIKCG